MNIFTRFFNRLMRKSALYSDLEVIDSAYFPSRKSLGGVKPNSRIDYPCHIETPSGLYMEENTRLRCNACIINAPGEKVVVRKYTAIGPNCVIIPNNHQSTVGIPHYLLGLAHVNDTSKDIIIEEDVWVGANVTMVAGAHLGRGCIVAAGAVVSKPVPPYSVVAGVPAKVVAKKFELEDIIAHEKVLYKESERMSREELEALFSEHFAGKKTFGTNKPLSAEDIERLNAVKEWTGFVEPY